MPPIFIAEACSNHHRDLDRALRFVDVAAEAGCDAVKFQLFRIDKLFAPEILAKSAAIRARTASELPVEFLAPLADRCAKRGIGFSCTPFYLEAVEELRPYVAFYKVASSELLRDDLLSACAATGKPVVLATGMATMAEIKHAVEVLKQAGAADITLLHCVSAYPTPPDQADLSAIAAIREATGCKTGWSDHSRSPAVIFRAVHRWGAAAVEFHYDIDGKGEEYALGHCWLPQEIAPVIAEIRQGFAADGDGFQATQPAERAERDWRSDPADGFRPMRAFRAGWEPPA